MKNSLISVAAVVALSSFGFAGGDIDPVEPLVPEVETEMVETFAGNAYVGIGGSFVSTSDSTVGAHFFSKTPGQDRLGNIALLAGYNFNDFIGVEGRYSTTVYESNFLSMDSWGVYLKPQYYLDDATSVYGLLGFGGVKMSPEEGAKVNVDDTGFQWGVGLNYAVAEEVSVFFDYTSLASDMEGRYYNGAYKANADALTLGATYAF